MSDTYVIPEFERIQHEREQAYWDSPKGRAHLARLETLDPYDPNPHGETPSDYDYPTPRWRLR